MKGKAVVVCFGLLLFLAPVIGLAQEPPKPPEVGAEVAEELQEPETLTGKVTAVDVEKKTLVVLTADGSSKEFVVDPENTTIWLGYEEASLQDIKVGTEITVEYLTSAEKGNEATWIDILAGEEGAAQEGVKEEGKKE